MGRADAIAPTELLQAVRLKGRAPPEALAASLGADRGAVVIALDDCQARDLVVHHDGRVPGWSLTARGRSEHAALLAAERERIDSLAEVEAMYEQFLVLNHSFKELCTDWQLKGPRAEEIERLEEVDSQIQAKLYEVSR